jgi:hypothetical protein
MIDFEGLKDLFTMLKVKHILKNHWTNFVGWGIVESMNDLLLESTQNIVIATNFIHVNVDEVTAINNTYWISLHLYVVQGWK